RIAHRRATPPHKRSSTNREDAARSWETAVLLLHSCGGLEKMRSDEAQPEHGADGKQRDHEEANGITEAPILRSRYRRGIGVEETEQVGPDKGMTGRSGRRNRRREGSS